MSRLLLVIACALALSGCGIDRLKEAFYSNPNEHYYQSTLAAAFVGADLISLTGTGKTIDDHIIGWATDQDCSILRLSKGGKYCEPYPDPVAMIDATKSPAKKSTAARLMSDLSTSGLNSL